MLRSKFGDFLKHFPMAPPLGSTRLSYHNIRDK
jgi:hypothetical protein